ncbi:class I SAM-dependent methyltransferase [Microbacterium sp. P03]|uniref:class I SAM-dependent methyltransferase n=1 Tax=Microbacterium sp. P03 TaxID=3366946 RepID=UPI0037472EA3
MSFPFPALRRRPDFEAPGLEASDAADRLVLDESAAARESAGDGEVSVIGDAYGALTLAAAFDGRRGIRVHQDALTGERALAANARERGLENSFTSEADVPAAVTGAKLVLLRLPRSLDALRDVAGMIAAHADPDVIVFAGGRIKHMTVAMNDVLREFFTTVDVTHARQKSRVLIARGPHDGTDPAPRVERHPGLPTVCAFGGAFAGTSIDIGTRLLLEHLPETLPSRADPDAPHSLVDLACGTGVVATWLALHHPFHRVYACDQSAVAVSSAAATAEVNGVADRITVVQDDGLALLPDASSHCIALNPPFHIGAVVHDGVALRLFADAARVLAPRGELWTVWNSALNHRPTLERLVGPTRQVARTPKFTVTVSTRRERPDTASVAPAA